MTGAGRKRIVALARGWIGTPYLHGAALRGAGCDCLGLVRGVWAELHGAYPPAPPAYGPDWATADPGRLERALARHLCRIDPDQAPAVGQVVVLRLRGAGPGAHLGILTQAPGARQPGQFVHAYGRHGVVESTLSEPWARRITARFELA